MSEDVKDPIQELEALRAAKEAREKARAAKDATLELELLKLEKRLEEECGEGTRGQLFEIVDARDVGAPLIAVKRGVGIIFKRFRDSKVTEQDIDQYVTRCLAHPTVDEYRAAVVDRPKVAERCALALSALYGMKKGEDAGKF